MHLTLNSYLSQLNELQALSSTECIEWLEANLLLMCLYLLGPLGLNTNSKEGSTQGHV